MQSVPRQEIEKHWQRARQYMTCDALLVVQNADLFYLTGTVQNSVLWFPREGEPTLFVRKSYQRACDESPLKNIIAFKRYAEIPEKLSERVKQVGVEMDVVPVSTFEQLRKLFPDAEFVDCSTGLRKARSVKTAYEIDQIRIAAEMLDRAFLDIPQQLREGMGEYELAARIEYVMRMAGHQGLIRLRRFNFELHFGYVSFGGSTAYPHNFDGPVGARGLYPAVPAMGGWKRLVRHEPVMVDVCGGAGGYIADGSRTYSIGPLSEKMRDAHAFILDLNSWIETQLRPGAIPSAIYQEATDRAKAASFGPFFMGTGENQVSFVAHGVGLELDEIPVIAPKSDAPLESGVVLAVEPKIFFPEVGGVGVENTYVVTEAGGHRLTNAPMEIISV